MRIEPALTEQVNHHKRSVRYTAFNQMYFSGYGLGYAGYGLGYGGYGLGYGHAIWKREAEAEPSVGYGYGLGEDK